MSWLNNIKSGDILVRELTGGGFKTESLVEVEFVSEEGIFINGADGDYGSDSVYKFSSGTGKSVNNFMAGWYSTLKRVVNKEDLINLEE